MAMLVGFCIIVGFILGRGGGGEGGFVCGGFW